MCGIFAILNHELGEKYISELKRLIEARGPDFGSPVVECPTRCSLRLQVAASVLHLRGAEIEEQPVVDEIGNVLLFNGQIYAFDRQPLDPKLSDTAFLARKLADSSTKVEIAKILSRIDGPFAFVYWHNSLNCLFYGRDLFGRKSLCELKSDPGSRVPPAISSVGLQDDEDPSFARRWQEVDCRGFHCLDFSRDDAATERTMFMWNMDDIYHMTAKCIPAKLDPDVEVINILKAPLSKLNEDHRLHNVFDNSATENVLDNFEKVLLSAVRKRIEFNHDPCLICRKQASSRDQCDHSKVAVAFSGGIDSTILALALHKVLDESATIDLITVAFKGDSPDRISVGEALRELRAVCPGRNWRLVICDIALEELKSKRKEVIRHLILPCYTVVDDSLGCACWFISRATGRSLDSGSLTDSEFDLYLTEFLQYNPDSSLELVDDKSRTSYYCPASMLFAGMGIDEQLGGYASHQAAWSKRRSQGLIDEIAFQMRRIPTRNLGRDDRTFSHHGRDVKLPFLDFDLVSLLNETPVNLKMNLTESADIGPKKLLRRLALRWGLDATSRRVKRALQFGTRIACLEDTNEKGGDVCSRLTG